MISKDELNPSTAATYAFDEFRFEVADRLLFKGSEIVPLSPKTGEVLLALVESDGKLLTKQELLDRVWADTFVEEANLAQHISALRKTLGEDRNGRQFIETIPRKGYRFVAPLSRIADELFEVSIRERAAIRITEKVEIEDAPTEIKAAEGKTTIEKNERHVAPRMPQIADVDQPPRRSRRLIASTLLILTIAAIGGAYWFFRRQSPMVFMPGIVRRLTTSGRAAAPKISPDGRYIVYLQRDGSERSLWIRQIATASDVRVTQPTTTEDVYGGIAFAPGGDYIYYSLKRAGEKTNALYKVPSFGGASVKILENLVGPVGFAPDGKRFAFFRLSPADENLILMSADADGGGERVIAERPRPNHFSGALAWSPDGATILCSAFGGGEKFHYEFATVNAESGATQTLQSQNWQGGDSIVWLPDGRGFLFVGQSENSAANQIWQVDYPSGDARQITNDADRYASIGLTADGRWLTAGKLDQESHLWTINLDGENAVRQITSGANNYDGVKGLRRTADSRIVYQSKAGGADAIWTMNADGTGNPRKIADGSSPAVSPDGRFVVFEGGGDNRGLWRLDTGDGTLRQLTDQVDITPQFSPDGRFIYFCRFAEQTNVYQVSIDGGAAQLVTDEFRTTASPSVSPDGTTLAFAHGKASKTGGATASGFSLIDLASNRILKTFAVPEFKFGGYYEQPTLQWTLNGDALDFIVLRDGVSNIWRQPITGGERFSVTNFKDFRIFNFAFAPDGKQAALARGKVSSDVFLIENAK